MDIAIVKGHNYAQEYDRESGRVIDRDGYHHIKDGFTAGFLAGFAYKFGGE